MTRKERSEQRLKELRIPINPHLPQIESEEEVTLRLPREVAQRAVVLATAVAYSQGLGRSQALEFLDNWKLWEAVTPLEKAFFLDEHPAHQRLINFSWRVESLWVLLWALGLVEKLSFPSSVCDVQKTVEMVVEHSVEGFVNNAKLRPLAEILDEADWIYRLDWAVVDANLKGQALPGDLISGVVYERHYALNWLIGYMDQEWDEVTTDT